MEDREMDLRVFGTVHLIYLAITVPLSVIGLLQAKKFAKTEKTQNIVLKLLGGLLLIWIIINRLSQVYRYSDVRWEQIIPDSFRGMTSLVLSLAVLFGKKDNNAYHFTWLLGLAGVYSLCDSTRDYAIIKKKTGTDIMAEYEMVREIQNMCPNNQMRDIFFEEVETDDPVAYVRQMLKDRDVQTKTEQGADGTVTVYADCSGMIQKFVFTPA